MQVGVLAVQGAFAEHEHVLSELGVSCIELRNAKDLEKNHTMHSSSREVRALFRESSSETAICSIR